MPPGLTAVGLPCVTTGEAFVQSVFVSMLVLLNTGGSKELNIVLYFSVSPDSIPLLISIHTIRLKQRISGGVG